MCFCMASAKVSAFLRSQLGINPPLIYSEVCSLLPVTLSHSAQDSSSLCSTAADVGISRTTLRRSTSEAVSCAVSLGRAVTLATRSGWRYENNISQKSTELARPQLFPNWVIYKVFTVIARSASAPCKASKVSQIEAEFFSRTSGWGKSLP